MATPKQKIDKDTGDAPASAPELSDEKKKELESQLEVKTDKKVEADTRSADEQAMPGGQTTSSGQGQPGLETKGANSAVQGGKLRRLLSGYWRRKRWALPVTLLAVVAILAGVPATRYGLAAYVVSQPVTVTVSDSVTKKPVTSADVKLDGQSFKTDKDGKVTINDVKVGDHSLEISKKYYKDASLQVFVPLTKGVSQQVNMIATGRQVPIVVISKISGKPLENTTLESAGTEVKTDKEGKATIVLPADKADLPIKLSSGGYYNTLEARVKVTDQAVKENTFALVPSGKVYFLSRLSGKIDVVKTDLDGSNRQVVVQGTGKEEDRNTVLLASRDWKYLALLSKRDSGLARLYLIDTSTDKMSEMDSGNATFTLVGWSNHEFVYKVERKSQYHEANHWAFKSFSADKKQLFTIDQSQSQTEQPNAWTNITYYQTFGNGVLVDGKLAYLVTWSWFSNNYFSGNNLASRSHSFRVASVNSTSKKDAKTWPADQYSFSDQAYLYAPGEVYVSGWSQATQKSVYFEYENGAVKEADAEAAEKFNGVYPTYLESPDGKRTFWSEQRDGRPTFFVGDTAGENGKQVGVIDDGQVYGWYGDNYLLVSKKGSELYIMPVDGGAPFKVADYHKPQVSYRGYGGGYGGL